MTKLIFIDEKFGGRVYEFVVPETTVGRGDHNMLTIRDASVSLTHCEILAYGPEVIVRPVPEKVRGPEKPSNRMPIALLAAALALGLVVLLWLLWGTG